LWDCLRADRENHVLGRYRLAVGERDRVIALGADDRLDLGVEFDVDLVGRGLFVPGTQDLFALAGIEFEVRTQHQLVRRRHNMLAFLILVDRIRKVVGLFKQDVAQPKLSGAAGRTQAGRT
jgi:hypothetical protein